MALDHVLGCLVGGMVGDAAGATLEFCNGITDDDVERALAMPGGGHLNVGPGLSDVKTVIPTIEAMRPWLVMDKRRVVKMAADKAYRSKKLTKQLRDEYYIRLITEPKRTRRTQHQ
jgi:hypothetical protein